MGLPRAALGLTVAACLLAAPGSAAAAPPAPPKLAGAAAAILVDARDGSVLFASNPSQRRPMASTTKLMTALLTLERARLGDVYTAPAYRALPAESRIYLRRGERMRVIDLLRALLLPSANDAAATLARGVAGSQAAFVRAMNARARELGLRDTSYSNPVGLDEAGNYSSARDLATLARRLLENRTFALIVDSRSALLRSGARRRVVRNRNDLVGRYPFVDGVKTGHTSRAGYVLVGAADNPDGARVVSVVMGEPSVAARDADTLALLRYGLASFARRRVLDARRALARVRVKDRDRRAALVPARSLDLLVRSGQRITTRVRAPAVLAGSLPAGRRAGTVLVLRDGRVAARVALLTRDRVPTPAPLRRLSDLLGDILLAMAIVVMVAGAALAGAHRVRARRSRGERVHTT